MDDATLHRVMGSMGASSAPSPSTATPDLSQIFGAMNSDGTSDFTALAKASGMDPGEMKDFTSKLWAQLDELSSDPEAYQSFLREKARDAGVDPTGGGGGGDALSGWDSNTSGMPGTGTGERRGANSSEMHHAERATFLAPAPTRNASGAEKDSSSWNVGVVAVWRASSDIESLTPVPLDQTNTNTFVPCRLRAPVRTEKVALPDPRESHGAESFVSPLERLMSASSDPKVIDATVYDIEVHPDVVKHALENPAYQEFLIESATKFAEKHDPSVSFIRDPPGGRRCYARRGEASARAAAAAAAADARAAGLIGTEDMSASLMMELAGMGVSDGKGGGVAGITKTKNESRSTLGKNVLVSEVEASHIVIVERDASGAPILVTVTLHLPQLLSMASANLEVSSRFVNLDPGPGEPPTAVALPFAIDQNDALAKWSKKKRQLTIKAKPKNL